jgi:hypothetical protein
VIRAEQYLKAFPDKPLARHSLDLPFVKTIAIEDLKRVKHGTRGTFSRPLGSCLIGCMPMLWIS